MGKQPEEKKEGEGGSQDGGVFRARKKRGGGSQDGGVFFYGGESWFDVLLVEFNVLLNLSLRTASCCKSG